MANKHIPIEGYPPHYKEFLLQASVMPEGKKIPFPNKPLATTTRARINQYRSVVKAQEPELYSRIAGVEMRIIVENGQVFLHGRLRGADDTHLFEAAGIVPEKLNPAGVAGADPIADIISELTPSKHKL